MIAKRFEDIDDAMLPREITENEYIKAFVNEMMHMSNELTDLLDEKDEFSDSYYIAEEFLPMIREFIVKTTGL